MKLKAGQWNGREMGLLAERSVVNLVMGCMTT